MIFTSKSPTETQKFGAKLAKQLASQKNRAPIQIDLLGEVGAGKTTFVQGMAQGLGLKTYTVSSPTFTMIHQYGHLIHVDLYRIEKQTEFETLGLEDYLAPGNILMIEWADRAPEFKTERQIQIRFEVLSEKERRIEVSNIDL